MQLPQAVTARKMMNDVVASTQPQLAEGGRGNVVTFGSYDLQLSGMDGKKKMKGGYQYFCPLYWLQLLCVSLLVRLIVCMLFAF